MYWNAQNGLYKYPRRTSRGHSLIPDSHSITVLVLAVATIHHGQSQSFGDAWPRTHAHRRRVRLSLLVWAAEMAGPENGTPRLGYILHQRTITYVRLLSNDDGASWLAAATTTGIAICFARISDPDCIRRRTPEHHLTRRFPYE